MPDNDVPQAQGAWQPAQRAPRAPAAPLPGVAGNPLAPPPGGGGAQWQAPAQGEAQGRGLPLSEAHRNWTQKNLPMTQDVVQATKPYFDVVQNLGRAFKDGHQTSFDEAEFRKKNPEASPMDVAARQAKVELNKAMVPQADALREAYKDVNFANASPEQRQTFKEQYDAIRQGAGRAEQSDMEKLLPEDSPLRTKLDPMTGAFRDPGTGLYADMQKVGQGEEAKNVLVLGGTGVGKMLGKQVAADAGQAMGSIPANYRQAAELGDTLQKALGEGAKFETAGHSLGGGLANYVGLKLGVPNTGFNAAALGAGTRDDIPQANLDRAKELAVHVNVRGEAISDGFAVGGHGVRSGLENALYAPGKLAAKAGDLAQQAIDSEMGQNISARLDSAQTAVGEMAQNAKQNLQAATDTLKTNLSEGAHSVRDLVQQAKTSVGESRVGQTLNQGANRLGDLAQAAKQNVQDGAHSVREMAQSAKTSVAQSAPGRLAAQGAETLQNASHSVRNTLRSSMNDLKSTAQSLGSSLRDSAKEKVQDAKHAVRESVLGKKAQSLGDTLNKGKEAVANFAKNDVGIPKGVAAPHQYGQSFEMNVKVDKLVGANIAKHKTNAIEKGYNELANAHQNANVAKVAIGQRGGMR